MSITLVTGQPGGGKTAKVVDLLAHDPAYQGRPIFVMGIPELKIEHTPCPPVAEWTEFRQSPEDPDLSLAYFTFPANAVVVVDEAQRVYRPRAASSKVPPEVAAFETHRHTGVDFILITQHPGLLDSNIRKLIGRHFHIRVTPFGRRLYEWPECGEPESRASRDIAASQKYVLPKRVFQLYKSAELHTKTKLRMPWYFYVFIFAAVSLAVCGWYIWRTIAGKLAPAQSIEQAQKGSSTPRSAGSQSAPLTAAQYIEAQTPRIAGLHHTAPIYDELTKPKDAPWPAACLEVSAWRDRPAKCRCIDQQGNDYVTNEAICRQVVAHGMFKAWGSNTAPRVPADTPQAGRPAQVAHAAQPSPERASGVIAWDGPPGTGGASVSRESSPVESSALTRRPVPQDSPWRFKG